MAENANLKRRLRASFLFVCPTFARLRLRWLRWQCRRFVCLSSVLPQRQRTCTTTVVTALCARHAFQHRMAMVHTHCVWKQRLQLPLCLQAALHAPLGMRVCATDNAAPIAPRDTDDRGPRCIASAVACTPTQLAGTNAFSRSRCVGGAFAGTAFAPHSGAVAGYWAMDGEIALHRWQLTLPARVRYCLPVLDGRVLRFAPWRPGQPLVSNRYGIPEPDVDRAATLAPEEMALVITPLTGFDGACRRLGMGVAGMIAASRSGIARRRRPGWSASASLRSRCPPCPPKHGM